MKNNQLTRTIAGTSIIILGLVALVSSLGGYDLGSLFADLWPALIIFAGIISYIGNPRRIMWPLITVGVGVALLLRSVGILEFDIWSLFWPAVIIAIGLTIVTKKRSTTVATSSDTDNLSAILGGFETKNESADYKGGSVSVMMGGGVLDLRNAEIKKEATLDTFALMGGYEIKVPTTWNVQVRVTSILGAVENKTTAPAKKGAPTLIITGTTLLGAIEIRH